ncbi:SDR family NAD(P)-dependent oxidoreductase [Rhodococcus opacus]|uniref:SDR family NAD(P)-dependent oxidoreductase n=1 Tax=Rhodococcus opacus TaxID=37919 RepID=UPI0034D218EF
MTGAGSGIGRAAAELFASRGDRVSCWDIREEGAQQTAEAIRAAGGDAEAVRCDVSSENDVSTAFRHVDANWGGVDVLFVNAGIEGPLKPIPEVSLAEFNQVINVNLVGAFLLSKHGIPSLRRRGGGAIVMTASILAHVASKDWGAYAASKGGIVSLARSLAVDHGYEGIRVNCIAPGGVSTELMHRGLITAGFDSDAAREYEATLSTPQQVAEAVFYLAGPGASLVNGSSLLLDNALTITCPT